MMVYTQTMKEAFTFEEAKAVGDALGIDWDFFDLEQFCYGMNVELEHGSHDPQTNVTNDDPILTGKIALAHLKEFPDYYLRLAEMENNAETVSCLLRESRNQKSS
jgi:hypothetical protein